MIEYECKKCKYVFVQNDDIPYCPACFCEDLNIINDDEIKIKRKKRIEEQENTEEFQELNKLQNFLERCNIKVWREVIPDQCIGWEYPYSVDLIFEIKDYGLIGVEGKRLRTHGQGSKYADAYLQIRDKYSNKTYFEGKKVRRWCVYGMNKSNMGGDRVVIFIKHFFNKLGISYLEYDKKNSYVLEIEKIVIDCMTKDALYIEKKILYDEKEINLHGFNKESKFDYGKNIK